MGYFTPHILNNMHLTPCSHLTPSEQYDALLNGECYQIEAIKNQNLATAGNVNSKITSNPSRGADTDITPIRDRWLYSYLEESPTRYAVMKQSMSLLTLCVVNATEGPHLSEM